jgi:hypothetical protein
LEQILTNLRRSGIVQSQRGAKGGYVLSREPWQITLLEIITSVEGDRFEKEVAASATVEKNLIHEIWKQAKSASHTIFSHYTLQDLCQRRDAYRQTNPMSQILHQYKGMGCASRKKMREKGVKQRFSQNDEFHSEARPRASLQPDTVDAHSLSATKSTSRAGAILPSPRSSPTGLQYQQVSQRP